MISLSHTYLLFASGTEVGHVDLGLKPCESPADASASTAIAAAAILFANDLLKDDEGKNEHEEQAYEDCHDDPEKNYLAAITPAS